MAEEEVDVLVLGGGPAGCAAALTLARKGLRALVVERLEEPAAQIGETLAPSAHALLADLGVWERFLDDRHLPSVGTHATWGSDVPYDKDFIFSPYGHGWHIDRLRFNRMLLQAAQDSGAGVLRGACGFDCSPCSGGRSKVEIDTRSTMIHARARFVIDATGRPALFARRRGARRIACDRLIGIAAFLAPNTAPEADARTWVEAVEQGWWYSARLPDQRLVVAFMTDADLYTRQGRDALACWQEWLCHAPRTWTRAAGHAVQTAPRPWPASSSRLDVVVGDNWLAAGDAAMAFDPLSSQGICQALASGQQAARHISEHLAGDPTAVARYARLIDSGFGQFLRARNHYYSLESRWAQSRFWRRRQSVGQVPSGRLAVQPV